MSIRWAAKSLLEYPDHPRADEALESASFILWSLSGRQYSGVRRVTEVYSTDRALGRGKTPYPVYRNGAVYNENGSSCCCSGCGVFHRIRLRGTPVRRILEVYVEGNLLSPEDYVILDHGVLGFLTPVACCASCVTITYQYGYLPPGGEAAAARLANELLASVDGEECSLPKRVTSITRQGTSFTFLDPQDFLNDRRTGIYEIDLLLTAMNPAKSLMKPRVFSVDSPKVETWTQLPPTPAAVVSDGDQAVICGHSSTWIVHNYSLRQSVDAGLLLRTQVGHVIRRRQWDPIHQTADGIALTLLPEETSDIINGDDWAILSDVDELVVSGKIRVV